MMEKEILKFVPCGSIEVPSSKSYAHRALIAAFISNQETCVNNVSFSKDILATLEGLKQLGGVFDVEKNKVIFRKRNVVNKCVIDANESGSTLRFLIPLASYLCDEVTFIGSEKLFSRPLDIYLEYFKNHGIDFELGKNHLTIKNKIVLDDIVIKGNISSQFITGWLFLKSEARVNTLLTIEEPFESREYVDMTIDVLSKFGFSFLIDNLVYRFSKFIPLTSYYDVEKDYSQMAFFAVLGALKGQITCKGMNIDSIQGDKKILNILKECGAKIETKENDITIFKSKLKPVVIDIANCIDLGPIVFVLASLIEGETKIINTHRLEIKESNRVNAMKEELIKADVNIQVFDNYVLINGKKEYNIDCVFNSHNDHRVAMALSIFALCNNGKIIIKDYEAIEKSYPSFYEDLMSLRGE